MDHRASYSPSPSPSREEEAADDVEELEGEEAEEHDGAGEDVDEDIGGEGAEEEEEEEDEEEEEEEDAGNNDDGHDDVDDPDGDDVNDDDGENEALQGKEAADSRLQSPLGFKPKAGRELLSLQKGTNSDQDDDYYDDVDDSGEEEGEEEEAYGNEEEDGDGNGEEDEGIDDKDDEEEYEEQEEDGEDDDYGYAQREEEVSARRELLDHHMIVSDGYDSASHLPIEEDLMIDKDKDLTLLRGSVAVKDAEEEDIKLEDDSLRFLQRPAEEDDGTPEEQMEFVRELERFFAERKMEYRHPKFYGENLNCLKLWRAVVRLGGYEAVTVGKLWRQVGDTFKPPKSCTTVSWSFHGFYKKALLDYERYKMHGTSPSPNASQPVPEGQTHDSQPSASQQPSISSLGRARRDAASRAMQGWHSQQIFGNGDVGHSIVKEKGHSSSSKRSKQLKMSLPKKKKAGNLDRPVHNKGSKMPYVDCTIQTKDESWEYTSDPSYFSVHKKKPVKQQPAKQAWKCNGLSSSDGDDIWITDEGPKVDWVKITVHKTHDCFEVYALIPGLVREEVRIQCEPGGQLIIAGEPEEPNNPWGLTSFKKIINLPLPVDACQTSAVFTLRGQLFISMPYDQNAHS